MLTIRLVHESAIDSVDWSEDSRFVGLSRGDRERAIGRMMRAGESEAKLGFAAWPYFALQAVRVLNCFDRGDGKSALELLTGSPTKALAALRPIGCRAIVLKTERELRKEGSTTMAERGWDGINLGQATNSPAYVIYVPALDACRLAGRACEATV